MTVREFIATPGKYIFMESGRQEFSGSLYIDSDPAYFFEVRKENKK